MPFLTIEEPQDFKPKKQALGIDLGTTHSLVALDCDGEIQVLQDEEAQVLLPSVVHYGVDNILVGKKALARFSAFPKDTIMSVKRLMGRSPKEVMDSQGLSLYELNDENAAVCQLKTAQGLVNPVQVSAEILKTLKQRAQRFAPDIQDAVITVPAYFDDAQRQATKDAAKLAGLNVLRLLNEPTAAAIAYGLDKGAKGTCLVFDLGGGTFDVSLLSLSNGVLEVLATAGDTALGGDDIDRIVAAWIQQQSPAPLQYAELIQKAKAAKEALSTQDSVHIDCSNGWQGVLTLTLFNQLIADLVERTLRICGRVLKDAKIKAQEIEHVVLVGGMTRARTIQDSVAHFFGKTPLIDLDPEKVVAMGAAIQASILSGNQTFHDMLLLDVLPLSLGIEMMGGVVDKILLRNTPIPAIATQTFTTYQEGQTGLSLHVVQGEREMAKDCRSLAHFDLSGFPIMPAGKARIEVTFSVDCDGLLNVQAIETISGVQNAIAVKPTYGLSEAQIMGFIEDSVQHASADLQERKLNEKIQEANILMLSLERALAVDAYLLSQEKLNALEDKKLNLVQAIESNQRAQIKQALQAMEGEVQAFAELRLNSALAQVLSGKAIDDIEKSLL